MSLSDAQIARLRQRYESGQPQSQLADEYGISQSYVSRLVRGVDKADCDGPTSKRQIKKLSDQDVKDMRKLRWDGWTLQELAEEYDVHPSYAGKVTRLDVRSDV